jgi:hypothetical protein
LLSKHRIAIDHTNLPEIAEGKMATLIPEVAARSRIIDSQGTLVWQDDCIVKAGNERLAREPNACAHPMSVKQSRAAKPPVTV